MDKKIKKLQHRLIKRLLTKYSGCVKDIELNGEGVTIYWNWSN